MEVIKMYNQISRNNQKENIDVIKEISNLRNITTTNALIMQEKHQYSSDMKINIEASLESINNIQRWFLRNPSALEDFNNSTTFYDGDNDTNAIK